MKKGYDEAIERIREQFIEACEGFLLGKRIADDVTTAKGDHDAYKVVCRDENRTRTSYMSPAAAHRVLFTNRHNKRGTTDTYEILEINL